MGTDSELGEIALEKILAVGGGFHQKQQDSAFHAKSWVYFSSCYSGAVGPASQFTCYIVECDIRDLPFKKTHWKGKCKKTPENISGKQSLIFLMFFLCNDNSYRKKQNTFEVPSAGYLIPGWILLFFDSLSKNLQALWDLCVVALLLPYVLCLLVICQQCFSVEYFIALEPHGKYAPSWTR